MLWLDYETRSSVDLKKSTVYRYCECPTFSALMCGWSIGGPVQVAIGEHEIKKIPGLFDPSITKIAHNAQFERIVTSRILDKHIDPRNWYDTAIIAAEHGLPASLDKLAKRLGGEQKDSAGTTLINFFCKPYRGRFRTREDDPEKWDLFVEYCRQDVETLISVWQYFQRHGMDLCDFERQALYTDQLINDRGIAIDYEMAKAGREVARSNAEQHRARVIEISGVENPGSTQQMLTWLNDQPNITMANLQKQTVTDVLEQSDIDMDVREVLELRQRLALVASKKYTAALLSANEDNRIRGGFRFYGAHTGRWAGRGVQPHNLPRASFETDGEIDHAIVELKEHGRADDETLKKLVRSLLIGPFTVVDYSAIEARVLAWLAGEHWVLDAFSSGRDVYVETAERMGGLTRTQGKVATLACGYQGGAGSLRVMGAEGEDDELWELVNAWREANPQIVKFWRRMENAFRTGGQLGKLQIERKQIGPQLQVAMVLPSGRKLVYHDWKREAYFHAKKGKVVNGYRFTDTWDKRVETYGGRLVENVTQAVARDVLANGLIELTKRGYKVVGHVHDEVLVEGHAPVDEIKKIICQPPPWAPDLPLDGDGFQSYRYKK